MKNDSDIPNSPRHTNNIVPFTAKPDSTVIALHNAKLPATSIVRGHRSPAIPANGEHAPYTHKNSAPFSPSTVLLKPNSFCNAGNSVYTTCRSAWFST